MDTSRRIDDWLKGSNGSPPPTQEEILNTTKMVMKGLESLQVEHSSILGDASNTAADGTANAKLTKNQMNEVCMSLYRRDEARSNDSPGRASYERFVFCQWAWEQILRY